MPEDDELTGGVSPGGDDPLRARAAAARAAIASEMDALARNLERVVAEADRRAGERLAEIAGAELERSLEELDRRAEARFERTNAQLRERFAAFQGEVEQRLELGLAERSAELDARLQGAQRAIAEQVREAPAARGWRERRHELKLARAESSGRVRRALEKLETRGEALLKELDARAERARELAEQQVRAGAGAVERAEDEAGRRIADAVARVEAAVAGIERSGERVAAAERRILVAEHEAVDAAAQTRRAAELEARIRSVIAAETAAAARISAAERRLIELARDN